MLLNIILIIIVIIINYNDVILHIFNNTLAPNNYNNYSQNRACNNFFIVSQPKLKVKDVRRVKVSI